MYRQFDCLYFTLVVKYEWWVADRDSRNRREKRLVVMD